MQAGFGATFASSSTTILASETESFYYVKPCASTLPVPASFSVFATSVLLSTSTSSALWNDDASVAGGLVNACGLINYVVSIISGPVSSSSSFTITSTSPTVVISVTPTLSTEVGSY